MTDWLNYWIFRGLFWSVEHAGFIGLALFIVLPWVGLFSYFALMARRDKSGKP
jgi:hypothetical protein